MNDMTSRERIVAAIHHQPTDVLPIDFGGMRSTGIAAMAYNRLKQYLGMKDGVTRLYDIFQQLAEPELAVLQRMGGDVVQLHLYEPAFGINLADWKDGVLPDGSPCLEPAGLHPVIMPDGERRICDGTTTIAAMPPGNYYYNLVYHPLAKAETEAEIDELLDLREFTPTELEFMRVNAERLYKETSHAILGSFGGNILEAGQSFFGYERFMFLLAANPDLVLYFNEKLTDFYLRNLKLYLDTVGRYIQVIQMGDDLGTQNGPQLSVDMYRTMIKPYQARQYRYIKANSDCAVFLHSCGAIASLIPDLIDAGVDILNPVQISAAGMDPVYLKREFGKSLTFWGGGANMQFTVPNGSIEQIRKEVRELIEIFAPGGGYVFNQVHNIQANVAPEKVLAIYDTALQYRQQQRQAQK